eukprot:scaffold300774_cov19-Tisochrysis_lutea.AAC.1
MGWPRRRCWRARPSGSCLALCVPLGCTHAAALMQQVNSHLMRTHAGPQPGSRSHLHKTCTCSCIHAAGQLMLDAHMQNCNQAAEVICTKCARAAALMQQVIYSTCTCAAAVRQQRSLHQTCTCSCTHAAGQLTLDVHVQLQSSGSCSQVAGQFTPSVHVQLQSGSRTVHTNCSHVAESGNRCSHKNHAAPFSCSQATEDSHQQQHEAPCSLSKKQVIQNAS